MGNPWIFQRINGYLNDCIVIPEPSLYEKMNIMQQHIKKIIAYKGEYTAMREARHHAAYYTKGLRGGANSVQKWESLKALNSLRK